MAAREHASDILLEQRVRLPPAPLFLHRRAARVGARLQQSNRRVERCRAEVHVTLRRAQVLVSSEFLDGPRWRATHRQVRTKRVTQLYPPMIAFARLPALPDRSLD